MSENRTSSYVASEMPQGLDKELDRLRAQALLSWPKELKHLLYWGLRPDMTVLEIGSGPGFITEQLAQTLSEGKVLSVEIDPVLIEKATNYLKSTGLTNWEIREGNVMHMDLPDNSVDLVYARYLFQHLPDPVGAAKEAFRVLKPGGMLVITDVDDKLDIFDPDSPASVKTIYDKIERSHQEQQASRGGNRFIGRRLPNILKAAGYESLDLEGVMIHNLVMDTSGLLPEPKREDSQHHVDSGLITEAELDLIMEDSLKFYRSDFAILLPLVMAHGQKPK